MKRKKQSYRDFVALNLNGSIIQVRGEETGVMLSDFLRERRRLTGTKIVCAEGDCGACSVLRIAPRQADGLASAMTQNKKNKLRYFLPVNSCITTVAQMDGSHLVTVDALHQPSPHDLPLQGPERLGLTAVQRALVQSHASQCGFCTPGFVIALTGLVEKKLIQGQNRGHCTVQETKNATTGNLCRCTGYQPIIEAGVQMDLAQMDSIYPRFVTPAIEKNLSKMIKKPILIQTPGYTFFAPLQVKDVGPYLARHPEAKIVTAGTDLGVAVNKGKLQLQNRLSLHLISDLYRIKTSSKRMRVGARVTLSELRHAVSKKIPEFSRFLDLFAAPQIKNVASLIGNVSTASPIGDTPPFLLTHHATLKIWGRRSQRSIPIDQFYLGYRKTALRPGEWIHSIEFDIPSPTEKLALYKASQRKDLDISAVNAAFRVKIKNKKITEVTLAMGGVAATPLRLYQTEKLLQGLVLDSASPQTQAALELAEKRLQNEITPLSDLRGSETFRRQIARNLFFKFFREMDLE